MYTVEALVNVIWDKILIYWHHERLLPDNALKRAQIRFFVEYWSTKIGPQQWKILGNSENKEARQTAYNEINTALVRVSVRGRVVWRRSKKWW
jgi:hypothetical protein